MKINKSLLAVALAFPLMIVGLFQGTPARSTHTETNTLIVLEQEPSASIVEVGPHYKTNSTFLSEVYEADHSFQLLGLNWQEAIPVGTAAAIEIRFRETDKDTWTEWQPLSEDGDTPDQENSGGVWTYVITQDSEAFQYRVFLSTENTGLTPKLSNVSFDYVDGGEVSPLTRVQGQLEKLIFNSNNTVISRKAWGANEDLRLERNFHVQESGQEDTDIPEENVNTDPDLHISKTITTDKDGNPFWWPQEYPAKVKKIIIHHTATTDNLEDPEAAIRAIYYYHTVTRGWGDIGYNFIVAPDGTTYEGRAGGDGVVAGHAQGYNTGSVGIALLGNYQDAPIPGDMMQGLTGLVYEKAKIHGIDPDATSLFRGKTSLNILGHRDVSATACPGENTYDNLSVLRNLVASALDTTHSTDTSTLYAYQEVGNRELVTLSPGEKMNVDVQIKNTGTQTWNSNTYLVVNANVEADKVVSIPKDAQKRTAAMKESSVKPGATATFTFLATASVNGGLAQFEMAPVFNGTQKTKHTMDLGFYVEQPYLNFKVQSDNAPSTMKPGATATVTVKMKNTGNLTWEKTGSNALHLVQKTASSLVSTTKIASLNENSVASGEIGTFTFTVKAPSKSGSYTLSYYPEIEGSNAIVSSSGKITIKVSGSKTESQESSMIVKTSSNLSFQPGEKKAMWVQIKNTTASTWESTGGQAFSLAITKPQGFTISTPRITFRKLESGASTKIYFTVTAPTQKGNYTLELRPRLGSSNLTKTAYPLKVSVDGEVAQSFSVTPYENPIRIKLTPSAAVGNPIVTANTAFALYDGTKLIKALDAGTRVTVTPGTNTYTVSSGSNTWTLTGPVRLVPKDGGIMEIVSLEERPTWDTSINYNRFRGTVEVNRVNGSTILINELALEDYAKGSAEETNTTPTEKLKTMAILYRTYAYYYITQAEKFPGMPYHGEDDPATFQKYLGYAYELRNANGVKAVDETKGMVVTYKGKVVKTPYFSKSDGVATKNAKDVWGWTETPWLVSVPDTACASTAFAGHGVGLSGCGAFALAQQGWTFDEIIKYYYTGVELTTL